MKTLSQISAVVVSAVLVLSVSACGKDDPKATPTPKPSPSATADPTVKPVGGPDAVCRDTSKVPPFTGPAAAKFGAKDVLEAYCEMGDFFYSTSVSDLMVPRKSYTEADFSFVNPYLDPTATPSWNKSVRGAIKGDTKASLAVNALLYFNLKQVAAAGYSFPTEADGLPQQVGGKVSKATTAVHKLTDGRDGLAMYFTVTNNIVLKDKTGKAVAEPLTRKIGLYLVPSESTPGHKWRFYSWATSYKSRDTIDYKKLKSRAVTTGG